MTKSRVVLLVDGKTQASYSKLVDWSGDSCLAEIAALEDLKSRARKGHHGILLKAFAKHKLCDSGNGLTSFLAAE